MHQPVTPTPHVLPARRRLRRRALPLLVAVACLALATLTSAPAGALTQDERFVIRAYDDILRATPSSATLAWYAASLAGSGTPSSVVADMVTSDRAGIAFTEDVYATYNLYPDSSELAAGAALIEAGDMVTLEIQLMASFEYFVISQHSNTIWVRQVYDHVLHRSPTAGEESYWADQVTAGTKTRSQVAGSILRSAEASSYRVGGPTGGSGWCSGDNFQPGVLIGAGVFCILLDRAPTTTERSYWVSYLQSHAYSFQDLLVGVGGSAEYYNAS